MKPFFTKKQKKMMRERKLKRKRFSQTTATTATTSATATAPPPPSAARPPAAAGGGVLVNDGTARKGNAASKATLPVSLAPATGVKRRRSSSVDDRVSPKPPTTNEQALTSAASDNVNHVVSIVVPSNLSGKEAKKFRKDARRKYRAEGKEVTFVDDKKDANVKDGHAEEEWRNKNKRRKQLNAAEIPRINDLVQEAKELAECQKKQQVASAEEEQLTEAYKRRYVALDCEMVGIGTDGKTSVLARVSIVDWNYEVLLDTYVQVESKVVDFRTKYSGIKPKHIKDAMKPDVVRQKVADLVRDKILVGHALQNDLHALLLKHPKIHIRDTSKYRPFQRYHGKWRPRKLRDLVKEHLGKTIQEGSHDSVTDAASTMELFRLVRAEWERELAEKMKRKTKGRA